MTTLPTLTKLSTKELLAMQNRTKEKILDDAAYILLRTQEHDDLKLMLNLVQQEIQRRAG